MLSVMIEEIEREGLNLMHLRNVPVNSLHPRKRRIGHGTEHQTDIHNRFYRYGKLGTHPYLNKEVKPIHVSYDAGKSYVEPSLENARNKTYPVVRPLFYYYETKNASKVRPFIDYVMSAEGQATVKKVGYIPVK